MAASANKVEMSGAVFVRENGAGLYLGADAADIA
jgi:hypothetical protein